jgi:hypothetical protein
MHQFVICRLREKSGGMEDGQKEILQTMAGETLSKPTDQAGNLVANTD